MRGFLTALIGLALVVGASADARDERDRRWVALTMLTDLGAVGLACPLDGKGNPVCRCVITGCFGKVREQSPFELAILIHIASEHVKELATRDPHSRLLPGARERLGWLRHAYKRELSELKF